MSVSVPVVRDELVATLHETLRLAQRLAEDARDDDVPVAELVAQATMLERLDRRREELIEQLRRTASAGLRATTPSPPIREVVLAALDELGWPQNAGFLEEYLWAKRQLQLDSRAFAPLRRDERRAWQRAPGVRAAYIVPALNPDGSANPRWLCSSAWELDRRVIASPDTERLLDLQKIAVLRVRGSRGPLGTLLERYAREVLTIDPPSVSASASQTTAWRAHIRAHTNALIEQIRERDDPQRSRIARRLARLPGQEQLWGRESLRSGCRARDHHAIDQESTRDIPIGEPGIGIRVRPLGRAPPASMNTLGHIILIFRAEMARSRTSGMRCFRREVTGARPGRLGAGRRNHPAWPRRGSDSTLPW